MLNLNILTLHTTIFLLPERERELCVRERLAEDKLARYLTNPNLLVLETL